MAQRQEKPGETRSRPEAASPGLVTMLSVAAVSAVVGFSAVYLTAARSDKVAPAVATNTAADRQSGAAAQSAVKAAPQPPPAGASTSPLSVGQMTAFVFKKTPEPLPEIAFSDASGKALTLADFKGKTVLLNLWATWCAPCRKEMPDLDRLQKELGSASFEVVALSVDRKGAEAARKFLDDIKVESLKFYVDPTARAATSLRVVGMPTTILIDKDGRELGRLVGPAEWHSADAKRLIEASLK